MNARERLLTVRMSTDEYEGLRRVAARHGLDMAEYVRLLCGVEAWTAQFAAELQRWKDGVAPLPPAAWHEESQQRYSLVHDLVDILERYQPLMDRANTLLESMLEGILGALKVLDEAPREELTAGKSADTRR
jgi:hypothetical protein